MKVLVTGVSGRLGPFIVRELEQAGHELVLTSRREPPSEIMHWPWVQGDVAVWEDCLRLVKGRGIEASQHAAAQPNPVDHPGQRARAGAGNRQLLRQVHCLPGPGLPGQ